MLLFFGVGLIEELAKLIALVFIARRLGRYAIRDGIVLGAAVGFGFAALESSGYALSALIVREGGTVVFSLGSLVTTELLRGILAPVGHGLWTALVGGVLFAASRQGRLRLSWGVVGVYLLVALLHGLWDAMGLIAALLTTIYYALPMNGDVWLGVPRLPMEAQIVAYLGFYFGGVVVLSLIGIGLLRRRWRSAEPPAPVPQTTLQAA